MTKGKCMGTKSYESPKLSSWGSITDLTQGQGMTNSSDDFTTCHPTMDAFIGSNGNDMNAC